MSVEPQPRRRWAVLLAVSLPLPVGVIGGWINTARGGGTGFDDVAQFLSGVALGTCVGLGLAVMMGRHLPFLWLRRLSIVALAMLLGLVVYVAFRASRV